MDALTLSETVSMMFQLAIVIALWGIYTEVRNLVAKDKK
jgi:hypothetical protein